MPKSLPLIVAAWSVPVLIAGQFAMLAVIPVAIVLAVTLRNPAFRPLRWWTAALTATYAAALILWAAGPDRAPSLSKDLHPATAAAVIAAAVATAIAYHVLRRRPEPRPAEQLG